MTAQELRIGNYYDHNGQVKTVTPDVIQEVWIAERLWCKPIPLTEEWLIKFGFNKWGIDDMPRTLSYEMGWIRIFPANTFCDFKGYGFMHYKPDPDKAGESAKVKFEYVHQLQNLFFCLTGSELTIKE